MEEKKHIDFNAWVDILTRLTARAQATFMNLYIRQMGPALCRSVIRYCHKRLDKINARYPLTPNDCLPTDSIVVDVNTYRGVDISRPPPVRQIFADDEKLN